jgi:hypothetical protein
VRLAEAEARITGEINCGDFPITRITQQDYVVGFVNARGVVLVSHLHDVPNHVREVALHGVRHGTAVALAMAQVRSGCELGFLPHGFPATDRPKDHESLIEDFSNAADTIAFSSPAEDIVSKVFLGP